MANRALEILRAMLTSDAGEVSSRRFVEIAPPRGIACRSGGTRPSTSCTDSENSVMTPVVLSAASSPTTRPRKIAAPLRRFRPRLALGYQDKLYRLGQQLEKMDHDAAHRELSLTIQAVEHSRSQYESLGLTAKDIVSTLHWATALRVLRDLHVQGWTFRTDDEGLLLKTPGTTRSTDPEVEKEAIRRSFAFARNAQLSHPNTVRFIRGLERRSVHTLFAHGPELAERLRALGPAGVQPELELVEQGARDSGTGLLLQDIWRYARHFWSIPYQSTPGRNMYYLVRDGAVEGRPLIGIAALGNTVLGLAQRDDYAGWSARELRSRWAKWSVRDRRRLAERLLEVVEEGIAETFSDDMWPDGIPGDWRAAVAEAERMESAAARQRLELLSDDDGAHDDDYLAVRAAHTAARKNDPGSVDWHALATTALYRRKRASTLADLIRARGTLTDLGAPNPTCVERALESATGQRAVETALRRIKQTVLASNVMELITCGAVPPYRELLGGKLTALLMLSRTVVEDYERKYTGQVSLIASGLAARPVVRSARLAWLTTSSLYAIGSSQYNRLKLPLASGVLRYERIGITQSFGTVHFAPDTVLALNESARLADSNRRRVNNLFGEGTSPKMRLVRTGLETLGLDPDVFLRHHSPRLLYGANLCSNLSDLLIGLSETPEYVLPSGPSSTTLLIEHWRERWLTRRLQRDDILSRVAEHRVDNFLLSRDLAILGGSAGRRTDVRERDGFRGKTASAVSDEGTFVERLYRSTNSYADRLNQDELERIHVDLGVSGYLIEEAGAKKQVIVTGNPGDGKTHLIERLRPQLESLGAEVITDANAVSDDDTLDAWSRCCADKRPFVLAINEWPLYVLQRVAKKRNFGPVGEALRQVRSARFFIDAHKPSPPANGVVTIDLALRNLLAPTVVRKMISRLTDDQFYVGLDEADPMLANRTALKNPQVVERLTRLLHHVGLRLGHVTMRQLVGFIAFLLSGGQRAADRIKSGQDTTGLGYFNLAFEDGIGPLFETVRQVSDPATLTHPTWDERLWHGGTEEAEWLFEVPASALMLPSNQEHGFRAAKRRFLFEHIAGNKLFDLVPHDEIEFENLLRQGNAGAAGLVRSLVLALNRFYEPDLPDKSRDRLLLWQSHRYDVRAPDAFVSLRDLPHQQLRIEVLRYADWVEKWLPPEQQARHTFALVAEVGGKDVALLEVDRELFLTLVEGQRGLGRSSWSRTATRRIARFVDQIDRATEPVTASGVEDVRIRNVATDLDETFSVQRQPSRFQV